MAPLRRCVSVPKTTRFRLVLVIASIAAAMNLAGPVAATGQDTPADAIPFLTGAASLTRTPAYSMGGRSLSQSNVPTNEQADEAWVEPCGGPLPEEPVPTS